jgi:hypothetical protein
VPGRLAAVVEVVVTADRLEFVAVERVRNSAKGTMRARARLSMNLPFALLGEMPTWKYLTR